MRSTSPRLKIVLVAVLFLLTTAPWASAGPWHGSGHPAMSSADGIVIPDFLSRAWRLLTGIWTKEGCNIDPSGRCLPAPAPLPTKEGCHIDPNGRCLPTAAPLPTKEGCQIDPGGRCVS
jgi:hypothetical protein